MTPHELLSGGHSSWFPAAVAAALSPCDALALASAAPQFRCVRLRATPVAQASAEWYGPADVYAAFRWQPLPPVDPARTHTAFVDATWKDQGWGNRKGMISVVDESFDDAKAPGDRDASPSWQGFRAGEGSPSTSQSTRWPACVVAGKEPAEHESTPLRLSFRPRNPKHALWARVGGGGGHRLEVSGCRLLTLDFCDPIDTVRAVEFARFEGRG